MNLSRLARASSLIRQSKRRKADPLDPLHDPSLMEGFATPDLSPNQIAPPDKQLMRRTRAHFKAINQMILRERRELKIFRIGIGAQFHRHIFSSHFFEAFFLAKFSVNF